MLAIGNLQKSYRKTDSKTFIHKFFLLANSFLSYPNSYKKELRPDFPKTKHCL